MSKDLGRTVEHPIQEGEDAAAGVGVVNGRGKDKAVGLTRFRNKGVYPIAAEDAALIRTPAAADAVTDRLGTELENLIFDPFLLKLPTDLLQAERGISTRLRAAVEHEYFHMDASSVFCQV